MRGAPFNLLLGSDSFSNAPLTPPQTQNLYLLIPGALLCKYVRVCVERGGGLLMSEVMEKRRMVLVSHTPNRIRLSWREESGVGFR